MLQGARSTSVTPEQTLEVPEAPEKRGFYSGVEGDFLSDPLLPAHLPLTSLFPCLLTSLGSDFPLRTRLATLVLTA